MATRTNLLEEAVEAWKYTRDGVIDEVRNLPDKDLFFRPAEGGRSALELVQHIIESGLMMAGELSRPDGDLRRKSYEGVLHEYGRGLSGWRSKATLLAALRQTPTDSEENVRTDRELHQLPNIRRFDGEMGSRLAWMNHGISHEEYHRGQIALCTRLLGRTPALTKKIQGS